MILSTDLGESWEKPIRIDAQTTTPSWINPGAVAVSDQGHIGIAYREKTAKNCYNTIFKISEDGGNTFSEGLKLNPSESCPPVTKAWFINAWPQGGDYCGMVALPDGGFRVLWSGGHGGRFEVFTTVLGKN